MKGRGIDGCRGGWVAVTIEPAGAYWQFVGDGLLAISLDDDHTTLIDMIIGLPATGRRECDRMAKKLLGRAHPRVFTGGRRPLLQYLPDDYAGANAWGKSDGLGVMRQLFSILAKAAQLDRLMTPYLQQRVRETHPELVFWRMTGGVPLPNKNSVAGFEQRRELLLDAGFARLDEWLAQIEVHRTKDREIRPDDLLDACACACSASGRAPR